MRPLSINGLSFPNDMALENRGIMFCAFFVIIVVQFVYIFTFNSQEGFRIHFARSLALMHFVLAGVTIFVRPASWNLILLASVALLILTLIPMHALGQGEVARLDYVELARRLVLPIMMIWMLSYPLALPRRVLWVTAILGTLIAAMFAFTGPTVYMGYNNTDPRLASITGGVELIHPSAKFVALNLILIDLLRRQGVMRPQLAWALVVVCFVLLFGYKARVAIVFVAVYYASIAYFRFRSITMVRVSPIILFVLFTAFATIALWVGEDVERWGSGRIGTWYYRLNLVAARDFNGLLFGGGVGADVIWTPVWAWDEDGMTSHNDYIFFLMDHGLIGLLSMALFFMAIWLRTMASGRAIVIATVAMCFFDNGIFRSPLNAASLAIVLSMSIRLDLEKKLVVSDEHLTDSDSHVGRWALMKGGVTARRHDAPAGLPTSGGKV